MGSDDHLRQRCVAECQPRKLLITASDWRALLGAIQLKLGKLNPIGRNESCFGLMPLLRTSQHLHISGYLLG